MKTAVLLSVMVFIITFPVIEGVSTQYNSDKDICEPYSITGFDEFNQESDSEAITSFKDDKRIYFSYNDGREYNDGYEKVGEGYIIYLDKWGNISDFQITVKLNYSYTGSMLGAFYVTAGSYYDEGGHFMGTPREGNYTPIGFVSIRDPWVASDGVHGTCAYPFDELDYHRAGYGSLERNGIVTYLISREDGHFNCTIINSEGEIIITNSWSSGINKPLNYLTIGGYIYVEYSETFSADYTDFKLNFFSSETSSSSKTSNSSEASTYLPFDFSTNGFTLLVLVIALSSVVFIRRRRI